MESVAPFSRTNHLPQRETRESARQLIKSLKKYQLNELAILLAAIHEEDSGQGAGQIVYEELRAAGRTAEAEGFMVVHMNMIEVH